MSQDICKNLLATRGTERTEAENFIVPEEQHPARRGVAKWLDFSSVQAHHAWMSKATTEAEVLAASAAWSDAIFRRDVAAAAAFLAPEYALMATGLGEMPRARWLENLPKYVVHSFAFSEVRVQDYGDAAVMRSRYTQRATVDGQDRSGAMLVTDVWVRGGSGWQVVARHTSFVPA